MRRTILLMDSWDFIGPKGQVEKVNLPHTWNGIDGQDGGNDYYRGTCVYKNKFEKPEFNPETECVYLQFHGVNTSATVTVNGKTFPRHDNGYSTFRMNVTDLLLEENEICVEADNSVNDYVYPQKADFTFYGGIYRNVEWLIVPKEHFSLEYYGGPGIKIETDVIDGTGYVTATAYLDQINGNERIRFALVDADEKVVASVDTCPRQNENQTSVYATEKLSIDHPHLWDGIDDPYLYQLHATLMNEENMILDEICVNCGIRTFYVDVKKGFFLNGRSYPLHGVSRHQDRKTYGNAITYAMMDEDMALIREMGANTIRLAHYQHDQYFYDLCDKCGMIVWAEIPYISAHMPNGNDNTKFQMMELIVQNYNHPSIITWGISNEITISPRHRKDMLKNHYELQRLCHDMDSTRPTTMACYAMCGPFNKVSHITDLVSWNLYLGWYVPVLFLNDIIMPLYHFLHPKQPFGYSEYGAEGMPNLHSRIPKRGDHSEEYQVKYHEYMLHCFERHRYLWATHVWNMFDFAADARNQGGEPGMNHKGLVTFDRKIKKDSFYAYKAFWSKEPFVHICGRRYEHRLEHFTEIKVYSNLPEVKLYQNGKLIASGKGQKIYRFVVHLEKENKIEVQAGNYADEVLLYKTNIFKEEYRLIKEKKKSANWV